MTDFNSRRPVLTAEMVNAAAPTPPATPVQPTASVEDWKPGPELQIKAAESTIRGLNEELRQKNEIIASLTAGRGGGASVAKICNILMDEIRITETAAGPRISSDDIAAAARRIASLTPVPTQGDELLDALSAEKPFIFDPGTGYAFADVPDAPAHGVRWAPQPTPSSPVSAPSPAGGVREALEWYAEQVAGCRKLGRIGDPFRQALDKDGGKRATSALAVLPSPTTGEGRIWTVKGWLSTGDGCEFTFGNEADYRLFMERKPPTFDVSGIEELIVSSCDRALVSLTGGDR